MDYYFDMSINIANFCQVFKYLTLKTKRIMKLEPKSKEIQEGGAAPAPAAEPMPAEQGAAPEQGGGEGDPLMQISSNGCRSTTKVVIVIQL